MPSTRRSRSETQAETIQHLLDAAEPLFERGGFHRTSVAEIARAAGYTTGAIYANFPRKEDLAIAVLERGQQASWNELAEELGSHAQVADRLVAVVAWRRRILASQEAIGILRLELWLISLQDPSLRAALVAGQRNLQAAFAQILEQQARDAGATLLVDPELLSAALLGSADGTAVVHGLDPASNQAEAFAWTLATLVIHSMDPKPITDAELGPLLDRMLRAARP